MEDTRRYEKRAEEAPSVYSHGETVRCILLTTQNHTILNTPNTPEVILKANVLIAAGKAHMAKQIEVFLAFDKEDGALLKELEKHLKSLEMSYLLPVNLLRMSCRRYRMNLAHYMMVM